jgi:hypothetical protein
LALDPEKRELSWIKNRNFPLYKNRNREYCQENLSPDYPVFFPVPIFTESTVNDR